MKVILIGSADDRARLRAQLNGSVSIVGEFPTVDAVRSTRADADVSIVASDEAHPDDGLVEALTPREIQVLELLAEGLPNKAIAARLGISDQTVKFHVASIAGKLGASNRTETVRRAVRRGLIAL
jgi:DNA-binding NarL/FixJ family response regulator